MHQKVEGWIPRQGTPLGMGSIPGQGAHGRQKTRDVSLSHQSFSLFLLSYVPKIDKHIKNLFKKGSHFTSKMNLFWKSRGIQHWVVQTMGNDKKSGE